MLDLHMILDAKKRIDKKIYNTPFKKSIFLSEEDKNIYFKLECLQITNSFKLRGVISKMTTLSDKERERGVVTVSSGNHGVAVSYAANILGIKKAVIFVPKNTPESKIIKIKYYGGEVRKIGANYDEAHNIGMEYISKNDMIYIDSYDKDPLVYAGQGTIALEILKQNKNIDTFIVPIGGGGLVSGIGIAAKAINPSIKIIGVQTDRCPAMRASLRDNKLYSKYNSKPSICEALIGGVGELSFKLAKDAIDYVLNVDEEFIKKAVVHMIKKEKIIAEPSSCVTLAAFYQYKEYFGKENALIISGSNIDEELMIDLLNNY